MGTLPGVSAAGYYDGAGPYVDTLLFKVIAQDDQQVLALLDNEIDLIGDSVDPVFLDTLSAATDIDTSTYLRNGYGYLTINTAKYPFNITSFRRAFAFALDKQAITTDVWNGLAVPQDSVVAQVNPFSIEGQLSYNYYTADLAKANQLLDAAGFLDIDSDGIREAPDGSDFNVRIEVASSSSVAINIGQKAADSLVAISVNATSILTDFYDYVNRLYFHDDYDMAFLGMTFPDFDVDWLAYEYWSEYADEPYYNFPNFRNASYDAWRDQLLHSTDYDKVYEAAIEMQRIWVYESPMVICYENQIVSAYRNDAFEGHVNDAVKGIPSWWTNQKVRLQSQSGGPYGGTFRWSTPLDVDTFNFMTTSSEYTRNVLNELYDPLLRRDPDGNLMNWLCESYITETHADNPEVPVNHTRFTFNIVRNATWIDGVPLTAQDIAFSYNYYREASGNPFYEDLQEVYAAYAPQDYKLVVEFDTESYWHLSSFAELPIIPKHYFKDIGTDGWNTWDPDPLAERMVTSGPYYISDYVQGSYIELTRNPYYFRGLSGHGGPQLESFVSPTASEPTSTGSSDSPLQEVEDTTKILWDTWSEPDFRPDIDPLFETWLTDGTIDSSISLVDGNPGALIYSAPWADMETLDGLADIKWKMDFKAFKLVKVELPSAESLRKIIDLNGVTAIWADKLTSPRVDEFAKPDFDGTQSPEYSLDMSEIRAIVGSTGSVASGYTGEGVVVGHIDTGCDFGVPDLMDAYDNGTYDPTGLGLNPLVLANSSYVADPASWVANGNVLTYQNASGVYLNVTGWDPLLNNQGSSRYLIGDGNKTTPYVNRLGFIWLYAYYWGIDVGTMADDIWQDIKLPDTSELIGDYRVGFIFQQRNSPYMKAFAPALVYNSSTTNEWNLAIDWEGAEAWSWFWNGGFYYESVNLTDPADYQPILDLSDWDFTDDISVATYNYTNPIVAADLNGDGINDYSLGAISWLYDVYGWFADETVFNGFRSDGAAVSLYFDADTHGTATAAHVASRGNYQYYDPNNDSYFYMSGVANRSKILSIRSLSSGTEMGAYLWACGFDYNEQSGDFYYTGNHQADLVTNSWGWVVAPSSELDYLSLVWTILSTPGYLDPSYPGVLQVFSAGNEGSGFMTIGPPGSAAGVLTVGASTSYQYLEYLYGPGQDVEGIAPFSSKGPSFLGYSKPDVVAPGLAAYAPRPVYAPYLHQYWVGSKMDYGSQLNVSLFSGTSQSAPVAAGVAALVIESLNTRGVSWTPDRVKTIIQNTAKRLGYDPATEGFGRIDAQAACDFVENDVGLIAESTDSFDNLMSISEGAWASDIGSARSLLPTPFPTGNLPRGFAEGSLYFGQVVPGSVTTISQNIYGTASGTLITDTTGWTTSAYYWRKAESISFSATTFTYTDTVVPGAQMYGWYNIRDQIGTTTYDSLVSTYSYVTIGISFDNANISTYGAPWSFLYDWTDGSPNDGMPNLWNSTTAEGNELVRLASAYDPSNSNMMSYATNSGSLSAAMSGNLTLVVHDPAFDSDLAYVGNPFTCTVIFWEKVPTSILSATDGGVAATYIWQLDAPQDDAGIYQGYVEISDGATTLTVPWSFSIIGNLSANIGDENRIVSGFGNELTPYDSPVYGCMEGDVDDWDFRSYALFNPYPTVQYMGVRVVWDILGNNMSLDVLDANGTVLSSAVATTSNATVVMVSLPADPVGMYYLLVHPTELAGSVTLPVNYTINVMIYENIATPVPDPRYYSNWNMTPTPFTDNDVIDGDHIVVNVTFSPVGASNFPESEINTVKLELLSGILYQNSGTIVEPDAAYDPFSGYIDLTQLSWEFVDGIMKDDIVQITVDFTNGDSDIMVWWADTDNTTWSYSNNLVGSKMATAAKPEATSFTADRDGRLAIGIFNYDRTIGAQYTLTVDTRTGVEVNSAGRSAWYDTSNLGSSSTRDIIATAYTLSGSEYSGSWSNITFNNFFAPEVLVTSPNGGEVWTTSHSITWTTTSQNSDSQPLHDVYVSNDGGVSFMLVASGISDSNLVWNTSDWQYMDTYLVRVVAVDRGMTDEDRSDAVFTAGGASPPSQPPVIWGIDSYEYVYLSMGHNLTWIAGSLYPSVLEMWVDDVRTTHQVWSDLSNKTTISIDGLFLGIHNYTLYAEDAYGNSASFTTLVTVTYQAPTIDSPADISYPEGATGNQIVWNPDAMFPSNYTLYRNGVIVDMGPWDGSSITVNVDGLSVGTYNYTLVVNDTIGNSDRDTVMVSVEDITPPVVTGSTDITFEFGESGHEINWTLTDSYPATYEVLLNGSRITTGVWNASGEVFYLSLDSLDVGVYNYTLVAYDGTGNAGSHSVIVSVFGDVDAPVVDEPTDTSFNEGETGPTLVWSATDMNPNLLTLYRNGTVLANFTWESPLTFSYSVGELAFGTYNFTLVLSDSYGNTVVSTVWVDVLDVTPPTVNSPADMSYVEGTTGNTITWTTTDLNPSNYVVLQNGTPYTTGKLDSTSDEIVVDVDGLEVGTYNFTVVVYDKSGNTVSDSVLVTVTPTGTDTTLPPPVDGPLVITIVITIGSIIVIIVVIILFIKSKR